LSASLGLIVIVAVAYFAAHVVFEWLARRFRIVSGAEYLVLGILIGPQVSGFMSTSVVQSLTPFMTLALGWIGVALGMRFHLPQLIRTPAQFYKLALTEAALTFIFVSVIMTFAFAWALDFTWDKVILPALSLGAIATATAPAPVALMGDNEPDAVVQQLEITGLLDGVFAICAFGILLCVAHIDVQAGDRVLTATEWAAISIGIGVIGGALFHLFIGAEKQPDRLFIALAGSIILSTGAAAFLRLSPLLPSLLIGFILVNTSANRAEITRMVQSFERPLYYVMMIFAGAAWRPSQNSWLLPVLLYLFLRAAAKLGSARLAARALGAPELVESNWGRGLLAQGTIALAIGMSYSLNDATLVPNVVFTAAIVSVLITDFFGVRIITRLMSSQERA